MVARRHPVIRKAARVTSYVFRRRALPRRPGAVSLMLALVASIGGCGSVRLNPDPEVAPSANVERVWAAPLSTVSANQASSKSSNFGASTVRRRERRAHRPTTYPH